MTEHQTAGKFLYIDTGFAPAAEHPVEAEGTLTEAEALRLLFDALPEVDMDPLLQLTGFLTSDDPSCLPEHRGVRAAMTKIGRDKLLRHLLHTYAELSASGAKDTTV